MEWTLVIALLALAALLRLGPRLRSTTRGPEHDRHDSIEGLAQVVTSLHHDRLDETIDRYVVYLRRRERLLSATEESLDEVRVEIDRARQALDVYLREARRRGPRPRRVARLFERIRVVV